MLAAPDEEVDERRQVVGFADMVGFTSLTRRATESELVEHRRGFEALAAEVAHRDHGQVVKMLGDEVLFVADSPAGGAEIALTLIAPPEREDGVPSLRAGLAYGRVPSRFGDVYGSVVNIASRLTSVARPGTVLVDLEMSEALKDEAGYQVRPRRPVWVRGYARLRSAALRRAGDEQPSDLAHFTAELLGLTDEPHVPLEPDDESPSWKPRRRRR